MPAIAIIGGEEYKLKPLVFNKMRKVWPLLKNHIAAASEDEEPITGADDPRLEARMQKEMDATDDALKIVALCMPDEKLQSAEALGELLLAGEIIHLRKTIMDLLIDSGLVEVGNVTAELEKIEAQLQASTATSTPSSPSSAQPDAKPEAGTE